MQEWEESPGMDSHVRRDIDVETKRVEWRCVGYAGGCWCSEFVGWGWGRRGEVRIFDRFVVLWLWVVRGYWWGVDVDVWCVDWLG